MTSLFGTLLVLHLLLLSIFLVAVREVLRSRGFRASLWPLPTIRDLKYLDHLFTSEKDASRRRRLWWFRVAVYCALGSFALVPLMLRIVLP